LIKITNTSFTGKVIHSFKTLDSTNNFAKILINQKTADNGTLIHTDFQTEGKGQKGNTWIGNSSENIYISFIFHFEDLKAIDFFSLNRLSCLSIINALNHFSDKVFHIKWPNDIYLGQEKIAGTLIENVISDKHIKSSIIGIGLNVNQSEFPKNINATSLALIEKKHFDIYDIIDSLAAELEKNYFLLSKNIPDLEIDYHRSLYKLDEKQKFILNGNPQEAIVRGVDKFGRLKLEVADQVRAFDHHEVVWKL